MKVVSLFSTICGKMYRKIYMSIDPIGFARKIGVNFNGKVYLYGRILWNTEPCIITLGNNVHITDGVKFITHDGGTLIFRNQVPDLDITKPIIIGNDVFIGNNVIILPGITIGNKVVIGAGSVVSRNIPDNSVAVGIPAKVIKTADDYFEKLKRESTHLGQIHGKPKTIKLKKYYGYE